MTLPCRLLCEPSRLRLASALRLFRVRESQWLLTLGFLASFNEVFHGYPKTTRQEPQSLKSRIAVPVFKRRQQARGDDVHCSVNLIQALEPPPLAGVGSNDLPEPCEIHDPRRTQAFPLLDTNKGMIFIDHQAVPSDS